MTKTAKILGFVAAGSLAVMAMVAVLFALFVGMCTHAANEGVKEGERRAKEDAAKMQESMDAISDKFKSIAPPIKSY
jgi:hypothetical protein